MYYMSTFPNLSMFIRLTWEQQTAVNFMYNIDYPTFLRLKITRCGCVLAAYKSTRPKIFFPAKHTASKNIVALCPVYNWRSENDLETSCVCWV